MKILAATMLSFFVATTAYAVGTQSGKMKALHVLKKYSSTVACNTSFQFNKPLSSMLKNVVVVSSDKELGGATYFVLWSGDIGCQGGSGTGLTIITKVSHLTSSRPLLVTNQRVFHNVISDHNSHINHRFIQSFKKVGKGKFIIIALAYEKGNANNFPTKKYRYTVERKSKQCQWSGCPWQITSKTYLGSVSY